MPVKRVAITILAVAAATLITGVVRGVADETMYVFFVGAVALVTWMGGLRSGLMAVALSIVAVDFSFIEPIGSLHLLTTASVARLLSFALVAGLIATLTDALSRAKASAERLTRMAEQQKAEAEAASATKSDFLATLSHEVRTPIHALLGYADLLEGGAAGPLSEGQAQFVGRLRAAAKHLLTVVNGVLDIAKADAGRLTVDMVPGVAAPVIDAAVSVVLPEAMSRHINMVVVPWRDARAIPGGHQSPARRSWSTCSATPSSIPRMAWSVEITTGRGMDGSIPTAVDTHDPLVWIRVTDHGPGISAPDRRRIFEPFVQGSGPVRPARGTGLGLAISRRLTRLMGGDLVVESEPGQGASFTVWLRAA